jgi:hypothetical protein
LLTGLAITPAALTMTSFRMSAEVPPALEAGSIVLGALFWGCGLLVLRHPLIEEIRTTVRHLSHCVNRDVTQDGPA